MADYNPNAKVQGRPEWFFSTFICKQIQTMSVQKKRAFLVGAGWVHPDGGLWTSPDGDTTNDINLAVRGQFADFIFGNDPMPS